MAFSSVFEFWIEISGAFLSACYVVVGPLVRYQERECVANANFEILFVGGASESVMSGRAAPWNKRTFDCTMGYPGEDVNQR